LGKKWLRLLKKKPSFFSAALNFEIVVVFFIVFMACLLLPSFVWIGVGLHRMRGGYDHAEYGSVAFGFVQIGVMALCATLILNKKNLFSLLE
jgi:hypothetical protein